MGEPKTHSSQVGQWQKVRERLRTNVPSLLRQLTIKNGSPLSSIVQLISGSWPNQWKEFGSARRSIVPRSQPGRVDPANYFVIWNADPVRHKKQLEFPPPIARAKPNQNLLHRSGARPQSNPPEASAARRAEIPAQFRSSRRQEYSDRARLSHYRSVSQGI